MFCLLHINPLAWKNGNSSKKLTSIWIQNHISTGVLFFLFSFFTMLYCLLCYTKPLLKVLQYANTCRNFAARFSFASAPKVCIALHIYYNN